MRNRRPNKSIPSANWLSVFRRLLAWWFRWPAICSLSLLALAGTYFFVTQAASATWVTGFSNGNWVTTASDTNWSTGTGTFPGSTSGPLTNADTATFLTSSTTAVSINSSTLNVKSITIGVSGSEPSTFTIGNTAGNSILLSSGGTISIPSGTNVGTGHIETINAPLVLEPASIGSTGTYTFSNAATSSNLALSFGGAISGGITAQSIALTLTGSNASTNNVLGGTISNGNAAQGLSITKTSSGTWTLNGPNSYSGGTTISGGILRAGGNSAIGGGTGPLALTSTGKFQLNGFNSSVTSLSGTFQTVIENGDLGFSIPTLTVTNASSATFAGTLQDGPNGFLALTKSGAGTLTLSGTNTYRGSTTISQGTLLFTGSSKSSTTASGGTLGGFGTIDASVSAVNGTIAPGTTSGATGTLNTRSLSLDNGSTLQIDLASAANDQLNVTGSVSLGGASLSLNNVSWTPSPGESLTLINNDGTDAVLGTFAQGTSISIPGSNLSASISYTGGDGNDVVLTAQAQSTLKYRSRQNGDWSDFNTWSVDTGDGNGFVNATSGETPSSSSDTIQIQNAHTVTVTASVDADQLTVDSGGTVTINNGVTFTIANGTGTDLTNNGTVRTAGQITNNGQATINNTLQIDDGGFPGAGTGTYAYDQANGILIFNNTSGSYGFNGENYWPTSNGPQTVKVLGAGGLTMSAARTVGTFFEYAAGVTTAGNLTLNGTSQVDNGGSTSGSPTYGSSSLLKYNVNASYGRNGEWLPNITSGAGYPANVQLSNNTNLDLGNGSTGTFTLGGNLTVDSGSTMKLNGAVTQVNLSVKGNLTNTGSYSAGSQTLTFSGGAAQTWSDSNSQNFGAVVINNSSTGVTLNSNIACSTLTHTAGALNLNGFTLTNSGTLSVSNTLKGGGTISGAVSVASGGKIAPGTSPGIINSGSVTFTSGSSFDVEIGGTTAGTQYDQLNVTGTVTLGNATLNVSQINGFTPSAGNSFTIINNDSNDAVSGTFNGLTEGATVSANFFGSGLPAKISYAGGDGNDVVISVGTTISGTVLETSNALYGPNAKVTLYQNGNNVGSTLTDASSNFSFSGLTLANGDRLLVFLDDVVDEGVTVTLSGTSDITNLILQNGRLIIRTDNGGTITNADLKSAQGASPDIDLSDFYQVDVGNNLTSGTIYIWNGATYQPNGDIVDFGDWFNNGTFTAGAHTVTMNGGSNHTIGGLNGTPFSTLTINTSNGASVSLSADGTRVTNALNVTAGTFVQNSNAGEDYTLVTNTVTVAAGASWTNVGKGDVKLAGNVANSGSIIFNSNGASCGDTADILIRSSDTAGVVGTTPRTWTGTGTFSMTDVDVRDQVAGTGLPPVPPVILYSGVNSGNNTRWTFANTCSGPFTWIGGANQDWGVATNWSPTRAVPANGDVLIFDGAITPAPTVINVRNELIAALRLTGGAFVTLSANAPGVTVMLNGATGSDLDIPSGTQLTLSGSNPLVISLTAAGHESTIAGQIVMQGGAHQLLGSNAGEITMTGVNAFTAAGTYHGSTHPFGTGTSGSVVFQSGATGVFSNGLDPFGGAGKSVVTFNLGSTASFFAASAFSFDNRSYGNLSLGGTQIYDAGAATNPLLVENNLSIASGSSLKLSSVSGGDLIVWGDLTDSNPSGGITPQARTIKFQGAGTIPSPLVQNVATASTLADVLLAQTNGSVQLQANLTIGGALQFNSSNDLLDLNQKALTLNGTVTGAGKLKGDVAAALSIGGSSGGSLGTLTFASGAASVSSLTMNRTGSNAQVIIGNDLLAKDALNLTNGVIDMGSFTLTTNASSVGRTNGWIIGNEKRNFFCNTNCTIPFDVGTANGYSPVSEVFTVNANTTYSQTVKAVEGQHPNISSGNALQRYWTLNTPNPAVTSADITFSYRAADVVGTEASYKVFKYNGGFSQPPNQSINTVTHTATVTGVSSFSDWTLAELSAICGTITVNPATLPNVVQGSAYNNSLSGSGGTAPYTFAVTAGAQPTGLTLNSDGTWSGTPTTPNTFSFTVTATDASGCTGSRTYTVVVSACPTTFVVGSTFDASDENIGDGHCDWDSGTTGDQCSLRAAIEEANALTGCGPITIDLTSLSGTINLSTTLPDIDHSVNIHGPGAAVLTVQRSTAGGTPNFRVFTINSGTVSISGLTISNGALVGNDNGGGILNSGNLTITNGAVSGNSITGAGGTSGGGGGIVNFATLAIVGSTISTNHVSGDPGSNNSGGGIFNNGGQLTIDTTTISNNYVSGGGNCNGGGIENQFGTVTITNSTVSANYASGGNFKNGGGIDSSGTLNLTNSTVYGNYVTGGVSNRGGGISGGSVNITNCTVSNNSVSGGSTTNEGGGVYAGSLNLRNTIIANSTGGDCLGQFFVGAININNLVMDGSCSDNSVNFKTGDPLLSALANNGGPTQTMALSGSSPALDAGDDCVLDTLHCSDPNILKLDFDQRGSGFPRLLRSHVDIGAFEAANTAPVVTPPTNQLANEAASQSFTLGSFTDPNNDSPWSVDVDWGDGSAHTIFNANATGALGSQSHTYADNGLFTVTVTVSDSFSGSDSKTFNVTVNNVAPTATFSNNGPINEGSSATVSFTSPVDSVADITAGLHYSFALSSAGLGTYATSGTASTADFPFADNGSYTVYGRVLDKDGGSTDYNTTVTVNNVAPTIALTGFSNVTTCSAYTLNLGAKTDPGTDTVTAYAVNWGDGNTENLSGNPANTSRTHSYTTPGSYTISVSLTDDDSTFSNAGTLGVTVAGPVSSLTVNNASDNADANIGDGICETATGNGTCTLRAAIQEANALTGCGTININFSGLLNPINLDSALPDINHNVNLNGPGISLLTVRRNPAALTPSFRVFTISSGKTALIDGLTIANGRLDAAGQGGGIFNGGTLTISNSAVINNAISGDGGDNRGAGIFNNGTLTIANTTIAGNSASGNSGTHNWGGAIYATGSSSINITNSTVSGNSVSGASSNNQAGAIFANGNLTIINSTLSGNSATGSTINQAGAIYNSSANVFLTNSTLTANSVSGGSLNEAGGIFALSTVTLRNTIIAGNTSSGQYPDVANNFFSQGHNLIGNSFGGNFTGGTGDQMGSSGSPIDPLLGGLAFNGGPTRTHALLAGSPAFDAGDDCVSTLAHCSDALIPQLTTDQRGSGFPRSLGAHVDIGAYEMLPTGAVQFSATNYDDTETNSSSHLVTVTVQRVNGSAGAASVHWATSAGTATVGSDYVDSSGDLNWADGDATPQTFQVSVNGDTVFEPNETINLTLSAATGASLGTPSTATITIVNDDAADSDVSFSGGNVTVTDGNGGNTDDNLTISLNGSNVRISDPTHTLSCGAGLTAVNANTCEIALASITGNITVNTLAGNDRITLDLSNGNIFPAGGIFYNGGDPTSAPGDKLAITGGSQGTVTYNYTNAHDGNIVIGGFGMVTYTGLEPISNSGTAADVIFNLPAGPTAATLGDDGTTNNGILRLSGATFEQTDFTNPTGSLTINRGNPSDTITVNALADLTASLTLGSGANPFTTVTFNGSILNLAANKNLSANASGTINVANNLTTTGTGTISLSGADVTGNGYLSTGGGLSVTNTGASGTLGGVISGNGGLTKAGAGTLALSNTNNYTGATTIDSGRLNINGSITSNTTVNGGGTLGGTGTIASANTLTVNSSGTVAPGTSPGILNTGSVTFTTDSAFNVEIVGTTVGSEYDQLNVTGTVTLGGATLNVSGSYAPNPGDSFIIVSNDSNDAVTGTFNGLPEGATIANFLGSGVAAKITYAGGDGNDVVLTAITPAPEIAVEQPVGNNLTDDVDSVDFGSQNVGVSGSPVTFTIKNVGSAALTIGSVTSDNGEFAVNTAGMSSSLAPGTSTTFTVTFTPSGVSFRSGAIHIGNNDSDENPFDIAVEGFGNCGSTDLVVNSTGDARDANAGDGICETGAGNGVCTLRAAIEEANAQGGGCGHLNIKFAIADNDPNHVYYQDDATPNHLTNDGLNPLGVTPLASDASIGNIDPDYPHSWWLIRPATELPSLVVDVTIDGYTQTGASPNTKHLNEGDNAILRVELNGSQLPAGYWKGLQLFAETGSTVRGLVIDHYRTDIYIEGASGETIIGNFLGTDVSGTIADGSVDGAGVYVAFGEDTVIGSDDVADRNLISGHGGEGGVGVHLTAAFTTVEGNYIGTDRNAAVALGNTYGVLIQTDIDDEGGTDNTIGCEVLDGDNVISGNYTGVLISGGSFNVVIGNFIGTDKTGLTAIPNQTGVDLRDTISNDVGEVESGNLISGNIDEGVALRGSTADTFVTSNFIGVAVDNSALGNGASGVEVYRGAQFNLIGGVPDIGGVKAQELRQNNGAANNAAANKMSAANRRARAERMSRRAQRIRHTAAAGKDKLKNRIAGAKPRAGAKTAAAANKGASATLITPDCGCSGGNVIAYNGEDGVKVSSDGDLYNLITQNAIYSNNGLGINLVKNQPSTEPPSTVTANDSGDGDSGPNNLQNFPTITGVTMSAGSGVIHFDLDSCDDGPYYIEFFANPSGCDPSGNGEGEIFIGSTIVNSSGTGFDSDSMPMNPGDVITATATDYFGNTSEFSACFVVPGGLTPDVSVSVNSAISVLEDGATNLVYRFSRTDTTSPLTVQFSASGTADSSDYTIVSNPNVNFNGSTGTIVFGAGVDHVDVSVDPTADLDPEANETVVLAVTPGTGYNVGSPSTATGTITDDDCPTDFVVDDAGDTVDANPGDRSCLDANQRCTLRAAIEEANALTNCGTINIGFNLGSATIAIGSQLTVDHNVNINGPNSSSVIINGGNATRLFTVNSGRTASISRLTLTGGNGAGADGGGIQNSGTLTLNSVTLSANNAVNGGAIRSDGPLVMINTTLSGNTATGNGGGLYNTIAQATLTNVTVAYNRADNDTNLSGTGGGIFVASGNVLLHNTIVADNYRGASPSTTADNIGGLVDSSSSYNLIGNGGGGLTNGVNNNQVGVATALLGALMNNNGPTFTHGLLYNSPAIDAGDDAVVNSPLFINVDQRGTPHARPADGDLTTGAHVDIGAYERQSTETRPVGFGDNVGVDINDVRLTFPCVPVGGCGTARPKTDSAIKREVVAYDVSLTDEPVPVDAPPGSGPAFDVTPSTTFYESPVTVCFYLPSITNAANFNTLKVLHRESGVLVDNGSVKNFAAKTVCTQVTSFSQFVISQGVSPTASTGSVSGQVRDENGVPVEGVAVRMTGSQNRLTITDAAGKYEFEDVETNGLYVITPSRANFSFSPTQRNFSLLGTHTDAAFTAAASGGGLNPLDTSEYFVRQQYLDFLGREPDESGFNFWVKNIESCGNDIGCREVKRIDTSAAFFLSIEFQQTGYVVYRTYEAAFGDLPDAPVPVQLSDFRSDAAKISNGVVVLQNGWQRTLDNNKKQYAEDFVTRSRFISSYPTTMTPAEFVGKLFANAGLSTSENDYAAAVAEFAGANDTADNSARARALRRVAENPQFTARFVNRAFVLMEYFGYLRRDPNSGQDRDFSGYNFWLEKLDRFNGNFEQAELVKAFLSSIEYRARFPR